MVLKKIGEYVTDIVVNGNTEGSFNQAEDSTYDINISNSKSNIQTITYKVRLDPPGDDAHGLTVGQSDSYFYFPPDYIRPNNTLSWNVSVRDGGADIYKNGNQVVNTGNDDSGTFTVTENDEVRVTGFCSEPSGSVNVNLSFEVYGSESLSVDSVTKE